jgi:hypothetical protein
LLLMASFPPERPFFGPAYDCFYCFAADHWLRLDHRNVTPSSGTNV